jgi:ubiquinone/menaquinone biosynthesis C-methylase UbiE
LEEPTAKELFPPIFSRHAAAYQQRLKALMARGEARGRAALLEWVAPVGGMHILDLACGPGTLSYRLAEAVRPEGEVVGIDLAPGMIERATLEAPVGLPVRFEIMDMEDLRFADGRFDAATCGHGLQFVPDLGRALAEARRILKLGSRMAASIPADTPPPDGPHAILERTIGTELPPVPRARDQAATRETVADPHAFARVASVSGFSTARVIRIAELVTWSSPAEFVEMTTSWWSMAARLEALHPAERTELLERSARAIESELGPGPLEIPGASFVLLAIA